MKTSELTGAALDWAVAKCEQTAGRNIREGYGGSLLVVDANDFGAPAAYSADWVQGGPIIERELLMLEPVFWTTEGWHWVAYVLGPNNLDENFEQRGSTPLIAAMRCYVASKLGDEVYVPEELV
jgi:hypothetical protein